MISYEASVTIDKDKTIDNIASMLSIVLKGFNFKSDTNDRFDEFPAFIATCDNAEFVLMSFPSDYESYGLEKEPDYFLLNFIFEIEEEKSKEYFECDFIKNLSTSTSCLTGFGQRDVSQELADYINKSGLIKCNISE
ncbi:hypothetical protein RND59_17380 [Vibrio ruber]|uniref:hypothetical protein n=1 Tax=Vibrio ruber TaxID=184755 RepID=UPI00289344D1|nr:hypothetical protein [Vibrio ruber]WNJ97893.1 hypothetical protein RND59_17380 [Vibrio ruber]